MLVLHGMACSEKVDLFTTAGKDFDLCVVIYWVLLGYSHTDSPRVPVQGFDPVPEESEEIEALSALVSI